MHTSWLHYAWHQRSSPYSYPSNRCICCQGNHLPRDSSTSINLINFLKMFSCIKVLSMSMWNPPPGNRKLHGDLLYLYVATIEQKRFHITCNPRGFFVNQSDIETFNPKPAAGAQIYHSLIDLLNTLSPQFKKNFAILNRKRFNRHPFERIATPFQVCNLRVSTGYWPRVLGQLLDSTKSSSSNRPREGWRYIQLASDRRRTSSWPGDIIQPITCQLHASLISFCSAEYSRLERRA